METYIQDYDYNVFESISVDGATGFTSTKIAPIGEKAKTAFCRLETAEVRYRLDGTNPASDEGIILKVGETLNISGYNNLSRFKAIKTGATPGILKVHYGW